MYYFHLLEEGKELIRQFVKKDFLAFSRQQKAKCVTWNMEMQSVTTLRMRFQTMYGQTPPVRKTILRWVLNFNSEGNVENTADRRIPPMEEQSINSV